MNIAVKLQIRPGSKVALIGLPSGVKLDLPADCSSVADPAQAETADAVVVFAADSSALGSVALPAINAAREDRLAWLAYPKAGKLGTDLNRDVLARLMSDRGLQPVRQVAIDDVWSALRFRPA